MSLNSANISLDALQTHTLRFFMLPTCSNEYSRLNLASSAIQIFMGNLQIRRLLTIDEVEFHVPYASSTEIGDTSPNTRDPYATFHPEVVVSVTTQRARRPSVSSTRSTPPPTIPFEILTLIFEGTIDEERQRADLPSLSACCLVSHDWYDAGRRVLYLGRIHLHKSRTVGLLLRTLQMPNHPYFPYHIELQCHELLPQRKQRFRTLSTRLVALCPDLKSLSPGMDSLTLELNPPALPTFTSLKVVKISHCSFSELVPLFAHIPDLRVLFMSHVSGRPTDPLPPIQPELLLEKLHLSCCDMLTSMAHWTWLLAKQAPHSLQLEIQQQRSANHPVARVIGTSVLSLHLVGDIEDPEQGDPEVVNVLRAYTAIRSLRVSGRNWDWDRVFEGVGEAPVEELSISWHALPMRKLGDLLSRDGLARLKVVKVYGRGGFEKEMEELQAACVSRGVRMEPVRNE